MVRGRVTMLGILLDPSTLEPPPVQYGDAASLLQECGYSKVGEEGAYRTWKHPDYRKLLTLRDGGPRPMYSKEVRKLMKHLRVTCGKEGTQQ